MDVDHHTAVNTARAPRSRILPNKTPPLSRIRKKAIGYVSKIKRPFLSLKGKFCGKEVFHINIDFRWSTPSKTIDVEIKAVDSTSLEVKGIETAPEAKEVRTVSLDPRRSSLSAELRLRIWRACWEPRRVEVHHYVQDRFIDEIVPLSTTTFRSTAPLPITLRICSESRLETLRYYSLAFASELNSPEIYFNFNIDCLYIKEADMFRHPSCITRFPPRDVRRVKRLAVPDMYVQHLIRERQNNPSAAYGTRSLARKLLEYKIKSRPCRIPNIWASLTGLEIVIGGEKNQRGDRFASWVKEGAFVCAHCIRDELEVSFEGWRGGPKITISSFTTKWKPFDVNPRAAQIKPIIRREGHIIYAPCCRLRPDELLVCLQNLDRIASPVLAKMASPFGIKVHKFPEGAAPCRCRLQNYVLSEGMSTWSRRYFFNRRDRGELGRLCKKWLDHVSYIERE